MSDTRDDFIHHVAADPRLGVYALRPDEPADRDITIIRVTDRNGAVGDIVVSGRELRMNSSGKAMKLLAAARVDAFIIQRDARRG